jgi:hypothetical protein
MLNGLPSWSGEQFFPLKSFCGNLDQELAADCGRMGKPAVIRRERRDEDWPPENLLVKW